jgi:hypothetical protein
MHGRKNEDVSGDYVNNSKNTHEAYLANNNEDCKWVYFTLAAKSLYDVTVSTLGNELLYECHAIPKSNYFLKFCDLCANGCRYLEYCSNCDSSANLFGCIGMRGKEYCILNKQYPKEEYELLLPKIKKQMDEMPYVDKAGHVYKYGEFFPSEISTFAYNESMANELSPMSEDEARKQGYSWRNLEEKNYQVTMQDYEIPDDVNKVDDSILGQTLRCEHQANCEHNCTKAFRVTAKDLEFYRNMQLSLPKLCPNCRHHRRLKERNPFKLYKRHCMNPGCNNEFETTYSPDRAEKVYCEKCYQWEVV